uniref:Uncharacterized protein n=1 Tax=Ditylenchus dipsaci TaxID=166011 RepID=A0A915EQ23_9BILA
MHLIACQNLPFAVVEAETFEPILSASDREGLKGSEHYSKWVMLASTQPLRKKCSIVSTNVVLYHSV